MCTCSEIFCKTSDIIRSHGTEQGTWYHLIRKRRDFVYGIWQYKVISINRATWEGCWYDIKWHYHIEFSKKKYLICIKTETKWPPFRGRHFQRHFLEWFFFQFKFHWTISMVRINNKSALVQIMAWRRSGDKPLSEPMLVNLTDTYMRHSTPVS